MNNKENKQISQTYFLAILFCCCFLLGSILFMYKVMLQSQEEDIRYLQDAGNQNKLAALVQINGDFQTLEGIAACLSHFTVENSHMLWPLLEEINDKNSFIRMGLCDTNGNAAIFDRDGDSYGNVNLAEESFFQNALQKQRTITKIEVDRTKGEPVFYYAIPIIKNEKITGILCAVNEERVLRDIIDVSVLNEQGFSNIIDNDGNFVILSERLPARRNVKNISELGRLKNTVLEDIKKNLTRGEQGKFSYQYGGDTYFAVYNPISVNDWSILTVAPQSSFRQLYNKIIVGISILITAALLIFLYLLRRIRHLTIKGREALERAAYTNPVTGSPSYTKFLLDFEEFKKESPDTNYAVWYCDIKKFKYLNDLYGYTVGDAVLRDIASLIEKEFLYCHLSADNFAGVHLYKERIELVQWAKKLVESAANLENKGSYKLHIELILGIYCPEAADRELSALDMVNRANMAQKYTKQSGADAYGFYSNKMRETARKESELEAVMEKALAEEEFVVFFQPKVDIQNGCQITGAEALVRWDSKKQGLIPPIAFIPLFEKNGFIIKLDRYMMETACKWLSSYLKAGGSPISIAINVSRLDVIQGDFIPYYLSVKEKYQIPDGLIELEFTESMLFDDDELFRTIILNLQQKGFICSLDDFGAGYSSLNVLKNLPFDVLKLDMLFLRNSKNKDRERTVISSIISMAQKLSITTVTEGVETIEQVEFLKETGCNMVQGYVFARPMPSNEFDALLKSKRTLP